MPRVNPTQIMRQLNSVSNKISGLIPEEYRGEGWVYAAGYVVLYTLLMLFRLSTFKFICTLIYVVLINLLVLMHFGVGPLVCDQGRPPQQRQQQASAAAQRNTPPAVTFAPVD